MHNLRLRSSVFGTDENGNEVLMCSGDSISEISDGGPVFSGKRKVQDIHLEMGPDEFEGWNAIVKLHPKGLPWSELVTIDSIKLLHALMGEGVK